MSIPFRLAIRLSAVPERPAGVCVAVWRGAGGVGKGVP